MGKEQSYNRRPQWLRKKRNLSTRVMSTMGGLKNLNLHTVCESAKCPNLSECFSAGIATFMILGDRCTRNCRFCAVEHGLPSEPEALEGKRISLYVEKNLLSYIVITSVTRDDLPDGGVSHFVRVVEDIKSRIPEIKIELLVPDFQGRRDAIEKVMSLPIEVFGHNMETVRSLYSLVRKGADYDRSLEVLSWAGEHCTGGKNIKTSIMVGLGEREEELDSLFSDLAAVSIDILTIGQYLRPSKAHHPVAKYYKPEEFSQLAEQARAAGIKTVFSGPYVRSSYLAEETYRKAVKGTA